MTRTERISTNPNHFVGNHPLIQSEQLEQYYSEPEDGRPVFSSPFYEVSFHKGTVHWQPCPFSRKILERVIRQISAAELPGSEQVIGYAQDQYRRNCKAATIRSAATAICLFLVFLKQRGIGQLEDIRRPHIGAFIEHEQDRGLKIASVRQKLQQMFKKYLHKAGLADKGYTLHCLRHTCATELLNAGMRIECLQQLLGHSKLEVTRIYARLTDKTREQEYFKAMAIIEAGGIDGSDRCDH
jgi:hypothetical protein